MVRLWGIPYLLPRILSLASQYNICFLSTLGCFHFFLEPMQLFKSTVVLIPYQFFVSPNSSTQIGDLHLRPYNASKSDIRSISGKWSSQLPLKSWTHAFYLRSNVWILRSDCPSDRGWLHDSPWDTQSTCTVLNSMLSK